MTSRLLIPGPESLPAWWVALTIVLTLTLLLKYRAGHATGVGLIALALILMGALALDPVYERRYTVPQQLVGTLLIDDSLSVWAHEGANGERLRSWLKKRIPLLGDKHISWEILRKGKTFDKVDGGLEKWQPPTEPALESVDWRQINQNTKQADFTVEIGDGLVNRTEAVSGSTQHIFAGLPPGWRRGRQLALTGIHTEAFGLVRHPVRISFVLDARAAPRKTVVSVGFPDVSPPAITTVVVPAGSSTVTGYVDLLLTRAGIQQFRIAILNPPDWDGLALDNSSILEVEGFREKIRVLMISGAPGSDTRFVRSVLKQDPLVELMHFSILRNSKNRPNAPNRELSLIPFPYHQLFTTMLPRFDVVLLQNFNFLPYFQRRYPLYFRNLEKSVKASGTGLILTGGSLSFGKGAYGMTAVGRILGVRLQPQDWKGNQPEQLAQVKAAMGLPAVPDVFVDGYNLLLTADTTVLASVPDGSSSGRSVPIIVANRYGLGRGLGIAAQSMFDAGKQIHSDQIRSWLRQAVRWAAGDLQEVGPRVLASPLLRSRSTDFVLTGAGAAATATVTDSHTVYTLSSAVTTTIRWPDDKVRSVVATVYDRGKKLSQKRLYIDPASGERPDLWKPFPPVESRKIDRELLAELGINTATASGRKFDHLAEDRDVLLALMAMLLLGWYLTRRSGHSPHYSEDKERDSGAISR